MQFLLKSYNNRRAAEAAIDISENKIYMPTTPLLSVFNNETCAGFGYSMPGSPTYAATILNVQDKVWYSYNYDAILLEKFNNIISNQRNAPFYVVFLNKANTHQYTLAPTAGGLGYLPVLRISFINKNTIQLLMFDVDEPTKIFDMGTVQTAEEHVLAASSDIKVIYDDVLFESIFDAEGISINQFIAPLLILMGKCFVKDDLYFDTHPKPEPNTPFNVHGRNGISKVLKSIDTFQLKPAYFKSAT